MNSRFNQRVSVRLFAAVVVCWIGIHTTWFFLVPMFKTEGAIRVSPLASPICFGSEVDSIFSSSEVDFMNSQVEKVRIIRSNDLAKYEKFKNSQAEVMRSDDFLNRVADKLKTKNLECFSEVADVALSLNKMISDNEIKIVPQEKTELLVICMTSANPSQAELIVNIFLDEYISYVDSEDATGDTNKLDILEAKKKTLEDKMDSLRKEIKTLVQELVTEELTGQQEFMLQIMATIHKEISILTMQRFSLEARVEILNNNGAVVMPDLNYLARQTEYLNFDPNLQTLAAIVKQYETQILLAKETMAETMPELQSKINLLGTFKRRLEDRRKEVIDQFQSNYNAEIERRKSYSFAEAKAELEQVIEHETKLREKLDLQDADLIEIGRKRLYNYYLQEQLPQKEQLAQTRSLFNEVDRGIQEIKMEQQRPARISIASRASSRRVKFWNVEKTIWILCIGLLIGILFAFLPGSKGKASSPDNMG